MAKKKTATDENYAEKYFYNKEKVHLRAPTYKFSVGERVAYGAFDSAFVTEVLEDGYGYVLECTKTKQDRLGKETTEVVTRVASWVQVRPIICPYAPQFTIENNLHLNFFSTSIECLMGYHYGFGIDMSPDYQRDYVWTMEDKEALLDSIFNDYDIGDFVLVRREDDYDWGYEILDGKQRLSTIIDFYENRFPYHGYYFNELCGQDKYTIRNKVVQVAIVENASEVDKLKIFLSVNTTGRVMDKHHLEMVKERLEEIE